VRLTLSGLLAGTREVWSWSLGAVEPPEPFRGRLAAEPGLETSDLLPKSSPPANEGVAICCCCCCGSGGCCCCWGGCCSRGRPGTGVGDIPPPCVGATVVGDWLFCWCNNSWLDKSIDVKLLSPGRGMLPPQLLLLPRMLLALFTRPPRIEAGTLLFFEGVVTYCLKWAELGWEWLLPLLSLLFEPRPPPWRGGRTWGASRARPGSPCWQSVAQPWKEKKNKLKFECLLKGRKGSNG
jgi:hypothetical protein